VKGYVGKVLRVNLTTRTVTTEILKQEWINNYLGGKGLGMKYLYEELSPKADPLSPENKLILMTGMFTGTAIPCSGKLAIITKSPATGTILDCSIGGHFAGELKYAGYDAVIVEGTANEPVYLWIKDDQVQIRKAVNLWGKGTFETEFELRDELGEEVRILSIGQAGENQIRMACISTELYRQAGRGGAGAVMGSKQLKAIAVSGHGGIEIADIDGFLREVQPFIKTDVLTDKNLWAVTDGTPILVDFSQSVGILPTRNFQQGVFEGYTNINSDALKKARTGKKGCLSCALGCGNYSKIGDSVVEGPEYETLAVAGSNCGIDDLRAIMEFNRLCDDLGLDTISTGNIIAFAMELTEKNIYNFGLRFGAVDQYLKIPALITNREGIGAELALGVEALAVKYGGTDFAMHVKGLEISGYDPRGSWGMGLAYATADRGACHLRAWTVAEEAYGELNPFSGERKAGLVISMQHYSAVKSSMIICDFWALSFERLAQLINIVRGEKVTSQDLETIGERIVNLARLFNVREGFARKNDSLPVRIFRDNLKGGTVAGKHLPQSEFEKMLSEYYVLRGWDDQGKPSAEKVKGLAI